MIFVIPITFTGIIAYSVVSIILGICEERSLGSYEDKPKKSNILARPIEKLIEWAEKCDWL